ncbi:MAG TPA: hypothetical protein DCS07_00825 [Bdellovibrionales bacterium]|nr:MAG: hypothetical protein A2Z97_04105 [Bdellovibrionales bacterium GWB1_52_6]OFZ02419.1 MAG: hypothetical protein A2X97_12780 [Bdellovibrionales bacterium GWA1_52_35]OFZ34349.1 MAG: hypothetical protein A2070_03015 [Bdellovibrionales bacterium GWC1_52_8]HAR41172.1 hypothetical protein [Bdellovibrionales bacterium]HCM41552.1 hypothetical protein [Bdellovibrionales bacterium]
MNKRKAEGARDSYFQAGFKTLQLDSTLEIADQQVLLTHMPYSSDIVIDGYDEQFQEYRPKNEGLWLLHGHVHEKWKTKNRMINVGVDVWEFRPVPMSSVEEIVKSAALAGEYPERASS